MTDDQYRGERNGAHPVHRHGVTAGADTRYLAISLALIVGLRLVEVIVALFSGSLALLSDAGHMLTDVGAIGASLWAIRLAARPVARSWTFGWKRAEILSSATNGITLVVVGALLARPQPVDHGRLPVAPWRHLVHRLDVPERGHWRFGC